MKELLKNALEEILWFIPQLIAFCLLALTVLGLLALGGFIWELVLEGKIVIAI